jgi:hypothetical protein
MSSFISGFRAVLAALVAILVIEAAIYAAHPSTFVERSNYLDWNYGTPEIFHKAIIYQKLEDFADSSPDIIQVGDSSGLHGVRPDIVMRHLGGMKYLNLSCCAPTGFNGYYAIADFMFRRNPSIKVLVLYISLNNMPQVGAVAGDRIAGGPERVRASFTDVWTYFNPPSMALRRQATDAVYSRWGNLRAREKRFFEVGGIFEDMLESVGEHAGWWGEHDDRFAGTRLREFWRGLCGEDGTRLVGDGDVNYMHDPVVGKRSYARAYFQLFADLAARHGAKLVVMIQPYPCQKFEGGFVQARRADLEFVRNANPNMAYRPEAVFEPWPTAMFTGADHLRSDYDEVNSERVGRFLADVLGIPDTAERRQARPREHAAESTESRQRSIWPSAGDAGVKMDGLAVAPSRPSDGLLPVPVQLKEGKDVGQHLVEIDLKDTHPATRYMVSAIVKPIGDRRLRLEVLEAGSSADRGNVQCNFDRLEALRGARTADAGLEILPDGWMRCWVVPAITPANAIVNLVVLNEGGRRFYAGDGTSGILVKDVIVEPWQLPSWTSQSSGR